MDKTSRGPAQAPLGKLNTHPTPSTGPADSRGGLLWQEEQKRPEQQSDANAQKPQGTLLGLESFVTLIPAGARLSETHFAQVIFKFSCVLVYVLTQLQGEGNRGTRRLFGGPGIERKMAKRWEQIIQISRQICILAPWRRVTLQMGKL